MKLNIQTPTFYEDKIETTGYIAMDEGVKCQDIEYSGEGQEPASMYYTTVTANSFAVKPVEIDRLQYFRQIKEGLKEIGVDLDFLMWKVSSVEKCKSQLNVLESEKIHMQRKLEEAQREITALKSRLHNVENNNQFLQGQLIGQQVEANKAARERDEANRRYMSDLLSRTAIQSTPTFTTYRTTGVDYNPYESYHTKYATSSDTREMKPAVTISTTDIQESPGGDARAIIGLLSATTITNANSAVKTVLAKNESTELRKALDPEESIAIAVEYMNKVRDRQLLTSYYNDIGVTSCVS